jgi:pimeloyl-ACP methyl ester carboxylesterase
MTQPTHIASNDLTLAARIAGDNTKPGLILLHGWPQTSLAWEGVLPELGRDNFALAFDLPGVGSSNDASPSAEKAALAYSILTAAENAGAKSIIICGYDVGGMIAYAAARDFGARIEGAVVMNTVIPGLEPWEKVIADPRIWHFAFHNVPNLPELLVAGHERKYFDFFYDFMAANKESLPNDRRDAYARGYARPKALKAGFDWYRAFEADAKHNRQYKVAETPILYLRGDADGRTPDDYVKGIVQAGAKHVETGVLPKSGEYAPEEAPGALIEALRRFRKNCAAIREGSRRR